MTRKSIITKELAIIERKLSETTNQVLKDALKKKEARLKSELKDASKTAPQLAQTLLAQKQKVKSLSKIDFNDLVRRLAKKPEYAFLKTMSKSTVRTDLERKAKPVGWRFKGRGNYDKPTMTQVAKGKKSGSVYREARAIRSDVNLNVRLGQGGVVINGISINVGDKGTYGRSKENITITGITPKIINFTTSEGKKKGIYRDAFAKSYVPNDSKKNNDIQKVENADKVYNIQGVSLKKGDKFQISDDSAIYTFQGLEKNNRYGFDQIVAFNPYKNIIEPIWRIDTMESNDLFIKKYNGPDVVETKQNTKPITQEPISQKTNSGRITMDDKMKLSAYKKLELRKKELKYLSKDRYKYEKDILDNILGDDYIANELKYMKEYGGSRLIINFNQTNLNARYYVIDITSLYGNNYFLNMWDNIPKKFGKKPPVAKNKKNVVFSTSTATSYTNPNDDKEYKIDELIQLAEYKKDKMSQGGKINIGDTWEWHTIEYDPKRGNNYKFVKKVKIIDVNSKGEIIGQVDGTSQRYIIRNPEKNLKNKMK